MKLNSNVANIEITGIRKFYNKMLQVPDAISLTLGQPDFQVPQKIKEAMIQALLEDKTGYTANAGILELREEISKYLKSMDIQYDASEICLTIGGSEGILSVFTALLNPGDKVLISTPSYPAYESCAKLLGATVVQYPLKEDFSIDFVKLEEIVEKEAPKVMVLSFPSNPTGAILSKEDRDQLYDFIKRENIIVVSDEIYSALCFQQEYYSVCQYEELKKKIILVSGFSKMFSMTGLRLGYVCAVDTYMKEIMKVHQYNVSCAPSISQWGALEGLKSCLKEVEFYKEEFKKRRDYVYERLLSLGFEVKLPHGAFYIFPSIKKFKLDSETFCEKALREAKVGMVPGNAFGTGGEGYVRISYCNSLGELQEAMNRLERWIIKTYGDCKSSK